jgi:hypothetical protein
MTLNEFKYWLDGFSASIDKAPTEEQWGVIQSKLKGVSPNVEYKQVPQRMNDLAGPWPSTGPFRTLDITC